MSKEVLYSKINNAFDNLKKESIHKIIVLFDEEITLLGDCCLIFDKFRHVCHYYNISSLAVNFSGWRNTRFIDSLLANNPYIDCIMQADWEEINMTEFDLVLLISSDESTFLNHIHSKYFLVDQFQNWRTAVISLSESVLKPDVKNSFIFRSDVGLKNYVSQLHSAELYLSDDEKSSAEEWLSYNNLAEQEKLIVFIDSSAVKDKLLKPNVQFEFIKRILLEDPSRKILVYDELNQGKQAYYKVWLNSQLFSRVIFSCSQSLRHDICLMSSKRIEFIIGPCSGLMHCCSSVLNYSKRIYPEILSPKVIVYTGNYGKERYNINLWWGASPLVKCIFLHPNGLTGVLLDLPEEERNNIPRLSSDRYTADLLMEVLN